MARDNSTPTPKQQKLVDIASENVLKRGGTKTKEKMLKEAGYSDYIAKTKAKRTFEAKAVKEPLESVIAIMEKKRLAALNHITEKKLEISSARDLTGISESLTKQSQLLSGGPTERVIQVEISEAIANKHK